jgi:hypothetical protein
MDSQWERLRAPGFWNWHFGEDVELDGKREFDLRLPCDGHGLLASVHEGLSVTLSDLESGTELGWIDDAHFHPSCLRASEVLHVAGVQTSHEITRLATLLLLPFAVVTSDTDAKAMETAAQRAWEESGFVGACPALTLLDFRSQKVEWFLDSKRRWSLRQQSADLAVRPLYTLRVEDNPEFPPWLSAIR